MQHSHTLGNLHVQNIVRCTRVHLFSAQAAGSAHFQYKMWCKIEPEQDICQKENFCAVMDGKYVPVALVLYLVLMVGSEGKKMIS